MNQREIVCPDLGRKIDELRNEGFRLDVIYPADDPHTALLSRGRDLLRITTRPDALAIADALPAFTPEFLIGRADAVSAEGRAGMKYRDLIPGRLGGRYVASEIVLDDGGPVADWVHFHRIALQVIYVAEGWVRVVYEDQGEPFVMEAGDMVLQPPEIRHRVLESSPGLKVIEITAPALHETFADHEMELAERLDAGRLFRGQRFLRHVAANTRWTRSSRGEAQETALVEASGGLAQLRTIRAIGCEPIAFEAHDGELVFGFVLEGSAKLDRMGLSQIGAGDSFVIPPGEAWRIVEPSERFRMLHFTTARLD